MQAKVLIRCLAISFSRVAFLSLLSFLPNLSLAQAVAAYPDLRVLTPTSQISIGNPTPSTREFRFSHVTWNAGAGPLEIRPTYNPGIMQSQGVQRLYTRNSSGVLTVLMDVPIAVPLFWVPPSDYRFPLASFGLYSDVGGSIGTLVASSPKLNFCMTGDTGVGGVPNTPTSDAYDPIDCTNPNGILGLSVGWGDEYDYTDPGNNIDITSLPDGVYWLRSIADPYHLLQESDRSNNVTDTQVRITGNTVSVLQQLHPNSTPPNVTLTSPAPGANVNGAVVLTATATPGLTAVAAVQFLVDGNPVNSPVTSSGTQYTTTWNSTAGTHVLTAQATASVSGFVGTAAPVPVTVSTPMGTIVLDQTVNAMGSGNISTAAFSTSPNEILLAFVGADGPTASQSQSVTVSAAGLNWKLVTRANVQSGDAEIWAATVATALPNLTVTSTEASPGFNQSLTVTALHGTSGVLSVGAHASAGALQGAPSVSLTTTGPGSLVLGVGSDWQRAVARTLGLNQQLLNQQLFTAAGVTFWVQADTGVTPASNTLVTLNDTKPTADQWNF